MHKPAYLSFGLITYWLLFWLLNGLDKFLSGDVIFGVTFYGRDRTNQFGAYFDRLGLSDEGIPGVLAFAGVVELIVTIPFVLALALMGRSWLRTTELAQKFAHLGLFLSMLVFIGFVVFDVIVGDRAELLEHSTYIAVICASFLVLMFEAQFLRQNEHSGPNI